MTHSDGMQQTTRLGAKRCSCWPHSPHDHLSSLLFSSLQVHDLLLTDISCHPERLAAVGTPSEQLGDVSLRQYLQMSGGAGGEPPHATSDPRAEERRHATIDEERGGYAQLDSQRSAQVMVTWSRSLSDCSLMDFLALLLSVSPRSGAAFHHLLHSVDEVLRTGRGGEYFKNIPKERLERSLT